MRGLPKRQIPVQELRLSCCRFKVPGTRTEAVADEILDFIFIVIRYEGAVWVRVSGDQQGDTFLNLAPEEQYHLLMARAEKVSRLEANTERRSRDFRNEEVAFLKPLHVSRKYLLRRDKAVLLPGAIVDKMSSEHFVTSLFEKPYDPARCFDGSPVSCHSEPEVDLHRDSIQPHK